MSRAADIDVHEQCQPAVGEPPSHVAFCFLLMLAALYVVAGPFVQLSEWRVGLNPALAEAFAWREGHLDIGRPYFNTAHYQGHYYNLHPPAFTLMSVAATWLGERCGVPTGQFYGPWFVLLVAAPIPCAAFWAFYQITRRATWAGVWATYLITGTALLQMLRGCQDGPINEVQHCISATGLLLIAGDLLGRRRIWIAAVGLLLASWSRSATVIFALPLVLAAWRGESHRARRMAIGVGATLLAVAVPLTLNSLKFSGPLDNGYAYLYADWDPGNWHAQRVREHGVMSPHFVPENLRYMLVQPPGVRLNAHGLVPDCSTMGTAIFWSNPLLLMAFWDWRRWRRDGLAAAMMLTCAAIMVVLAFYHSPGVPQPGYYRFALDFIPVWLAVIAVRATISPTRRIITLACVAYSICYFHFILG